MSGLSKAVIFISLLSGGFGGLTAHNLLGYHFIYGFILMASIVFFMDRLILIPSRFSGRGMKAIRIILAVILSAIYTLSFESLIFKKDVTNYFTEQNQHKIELIEVQYEEKENRIKSEIAHMQAKNDSLQKSQETWQERVFDEISTGMGVRPSGLGDKAKEWLRMKYGDSLRVTPQIVYNTNFINQLTDKIGVLQKEKQAKISNLIDPEDRSLIQTLEALQALIFHGGNMAMMVFYFCWFILWLIIEMAIIILKHKHQGVISDYLDEQDRQNHYQKQMNAFSQKAEMDFKKEIIANKARLRAEKENETQSLASKAEIAEMRREYFKEQKMKNAKTVKVVHEMNMDTNTFQHEKDKEDQANITEDLYKAFSKNGEQE